MRQTSTRLNGLLMVTPSPVDLTIRRSNSLTIAYRQLNNYGQEKFMSGVTSLCFSKSGKYLFGGYDDSPFAVVWDTLSATNTQVLANLVKRVSCVGMQSSGYALCTGSWDYNLRIWA